MSALSSYSILFFSFFSTPRPPSSTLFPYNDALPISALRSAPQPWSRSSATSSTCSGHVAGSVSAASTTTCCTDRSRSEEHTSELQSLRHLVCRLLLEKKKTTLTAPSKQTRTRSSTCC